MFQPVKTDRDDKWGSNYWIGTSIKLKRTVRFYSDLEYDHWLNIEMDKNIVNFCEHPLEMQVYDDGKLKTTIPDMWIEYKDGRQVLREVKYQKELKGNAPNDLRSQKQVALQQKWCADNNYTHEVVTEATIRNNPIYLNNARFIISQVKTQKRPRKEEIDLIVRNTSKQPRTLKELASNTNQPLSIIMKLVCWCTYWGICNADIDNQELCYESKVYADE